jgi:putative ABC transport system substrate-binding protein
MEETRRRLLGSMGLVLVAPALVAVPGEALAQAAGRALRIAILDDASASSQSDLWRYFLARLAESGFTEGRNLVVEMHYARGATERLPAIAKAAAARKPDIIVARGTPSAQAAKQATTAIPVVFLSVADPVRVGLIASLSRPGGNLTGLTFISTEVAPKSLELLREIAPQTRKVGYLGDGSNEGGASVFEQLQKYARSLKVTVQFFDGRLRADLERSFATLVREEFDGLIVGNSGVLWEHRDQILQFAAEQKFATVYPRREYVEAGGLVSYGAELSVMYQRAAGYVEQIAQGARPSELPVERSSTVRMVVNLKTARQQGIRIPQRVLVRADRVIE